MKRFFVTKTLVIGAVAALLVGGALATFQSSTEEKGDEAVYAFLSGGPEAEQVWTTYGVQEIALGLLLGGKHPTTYASLAPQGARFFHLDSVVSAFDATHQRHDALVVLHNETLPQYAGFAYTVVEHVDLEVRQTFRLDENIAFADAKSRVSTQPAATNVQNSFFDVRDPVLPGLAYQGATLELGSVLREADLAIPPEFAGFARAAHEKVWVETRAVIDGVDAYAVRHEVTYSVIAPAQYFADASLDADVSQPFEMSVRAWTIDWMTGDKPYAILRETGVEFDRDGQKEDGPAAAWLLQKLTPGVQFIPWRAHVTPSTHWADDRTDLEGTPGGQIHPADGTNPGISYPWSAAIAAVKADTTLLSFRVWLQSHPQNYVVGVRYVEAVPGTTSATFGATEWRILFASTDGSGHLVASQRAGGTSATNRDHGDRGVPGFSAQSFPANPPTLTDLRTTWQEYVSTTAAQRPFNYVRWGIDISDRTQHCASGIEAETGAKDLEVFNFLEGGHTSSGQCPGTESDPSVSSLVMETESGRVASVYEAESRYDLGARNAPPGMKSGWSRAASTVPAGVQPPSPATTAGASAGFLGLFLLAYFWPVLKFVGAKMVFIAGYAKIGKEDVLNNPVRDGILQLIRGTPGIHASDIARQANAGWGTIVYHLSVLEKNKMITSLVDGRHKRFFPADTVDYSKRGQLAALMNANTKAIYEMIEGQPGIIQGELAGRTGLTIPTVIWHLQRLEQAGLVGRDKSGRRFHYFANPVYQPRQPGTETMEVQ